MPWLDPKPNGQILWFSAQRCVMCQKPATHAVLAVLSAEGPVSIMVKGYCTLCSPRVSYAPDAEGREPVPGC